jgi:DNA invertase Pin-like site-specific DNA recombinase
MSGARADRPALMALRGNLDRYDVLCVWSLDRLGRDLAQMLNNVQRLTPSSFRG